MKKQKYRVSTTISMRHWALLKRLTEKYDTQQKVLELALESLENGPKSGPARSREEELWMRIGRDIKSACLLPKDGCKELIATADIGRFTEYVTHRKPLEYMIEDYYQKPLKECSLKEIIEGIVINGRVINLFDTISYTDNDVYYTLKLTHDMGINNSKIVHIMIDSVFKTYGAKNESKISERSLFINVFKN